MFHLALLTLVVLQEPTPTPTPAPTIRGRVVAEATALPIVGASVIAGGYLRNVLPAETGADGEFTLLTRARCKESNATENLGTDFFRVSAPGFVELRVDPCSNAPWAGPIPLRKSASVRGRLTEEKFDRAIVITARAVDLTWPPQSGLHGEEVMWRAEVDASGAFEFPTLPSQIELTLAWTRTSDSNREKHTLPVVLRPEERRDVVLPATAPLDSAPVAARPPEDPWFKLLLSAIGSDGRVSEFPWFEVLGESRLIPHRVGGGRAHVHHSRACNHLEVRADVTRLICRDVDGWVGACGLRQSKSESVRIGSAVLTPGTVLRLDATGLTEDARISIDVGEAHFVDRELLAGVVRYEVVPCGAVHISVASSSGRAWETSLDASSRRIHHVVLTR
jgi:hypothetical protein